MRAKPSGLHPSAEGAAVAKAMIARGDRQHDIAASFGVNGGRIREGRVQSKIRQRAACRSRQSASAQAISNWAVMLSSP